MKIGHTSPFVEILILVAIIYAIIMVGIISINKVEKYGITAEELACMDCFTITLSPMQWISIFFIIFILGMFVNTILFSEDNDEQKTKSD